MLMRVAYSSRKSKIRFGIECKNVIAEEHIIFIWYVIDIVCEIYLYIICFYRSAVETSNARMFLCANGKRFTMKTDNYKSIYFINQQSSDSIATSIVYSSIFEYHFRIRMFISFCVFFFLFFSQKLLIDNEQWRHFNCSISIDCVLLKTNFKLN